MVLKNRLAYLATKGPEAQRGATLTREQLPNFKFDKRVDVSRCSKDTSKEPLLANFGAASTIFSPKLFFS